MMLPLLCGLSVRLYRLVLLRYPRRLRRRFAADMVELFEAMLVEASRRAGVRGIAGVWWRTLTDSLRPLPGEVKHASAAGDGGPVDSGIDGREKMTTGAWMAGWAEDGSFALRSLTREPRFAGLAVGVLGIGISLVTTVSLV